MSAKHHYIVAGFFNNQFNTLEEAKWNVKVAFTHIEAIKYLKDEVICHYIGDKLHSETPIHVDEAGNITFGKTCKVKL